MAEWAKYRLVDLVDYVNGGAWPASAYALGYNGIPVVRVTDVKNFSIDLASCKYLKANLEEKYIKHKLVKGDLIVCTVGSHPSQQSSVVGKTAIVSAKADGAYLNQNAVLLRAKEEYIDKRYLGAFSRSIIFKEYVEANARGSANQVRLAISSLLEMELRLPSLPEQRRIAETLSALDDKIELNRRMNQTLEQMAQTLFRQNFMEGIDAKKLPEGWKQKTLEDVVDITSSKRIFLQDYVPNGIPFYRGKEIIQLNKSGIISTELFITEEKFKLIKDKFGAPEEGDILLTSVGTIGIPYLVSKDDSFYFKDGNITWFKNYLHYLGPNYIYQWLLSDEGKSSIDNITIGSTQKAVTIKSLKTLKIIVPPKKLHDSVCNQLGALRGKINNNIKEIKTLIQTRNTLLPKLMSGEIDVMNLKPDPLHEPVLS